MGYARIGVRINQSINPSYAGLNYAQLIRSLTIASSLPSTATLNNWPLLLPQLRSVSLGGDAIIQEVRKIHYGAMGHFEALLARCGTPLSPLRVFMLDASVSGDRELDLLPAPVLRLLASWHSVVELHSKWEIGSGVTINEVTGPASSVPFRDLEVLSVHL
jgi:hypothetical protein